MSHMISPRRLISHQPYPTTRPTAPFKARDYYVKRDDDVKSSEFKCSMVIWTFIRMLHILNLRFLSSTEVYLGSIKSELW